jgi:hypothetical protein
VRIDRSTHLGDQYSGDFGLAPGIYPYLGAKAGLDWLAAAVRSYGGAAVPGRMGARLAAKMSGTSLVDPAMYDPNDDKSQDLVQPPLWPSDEWLDRQRAADVPVLLTASPRIVRGDRKALRRALRRWDTIGEPVLVVLPIETWWLRAGLPCLSEEVRAAGRPVGLVLMHHYNGLDAAGSVAGLLAFMSSIGGLPVVLLRCDISAVGAVAHGGFAGFIGMSARMRHGPLPIRLTRESDGGTSERDQTPGLLVPALHDYYKASRLPAFAGVGQDLLRCGYSCCRGETLLEITRLCEVSMAAARERAYSHNIAVHEETARDVLGSAEPADAWWESCKAGADAAAALIEFGVSLSVSPWLRQWLERGSPSHDPVMIG